MSFSRTIRSDEGKFSNKSPSGWGECRPDADGERGMRPLMCTYYTKLTSIWSFSRSSLAFVVFFHSISQAQSRARAFLSKLIIWHQTEKNHSIKIMRYNLNEIYFAFCVMLNAAASCAVAIKMIADIYFARKKRKKLSAGKNSE